MLRDRRPIHAAIVLVASAFVLAGCGGGGDPGAGDPAAGGTPTPDAGAGTSTVANPGATGTTGAVDPVTGLPATDSNGTSDGGTTATVPDLVGSNVAGLEPVTGNTPLFDPNAISEEQLNQQQKDGATGAGSTTTTETQTETKPTVTYTGAKIYVDGITHTVNRNGTFPKGNPVFRLLSVSGSSIEIELVAGEFTSSGGDGTFLDLGDMVSLVNASEQVTYRVKYLRPITATTGVTF